MNFGKVPVHQLNSIDFSLPAEPEGNGEILSGEKHSDPRVYLGCAKWGRPEWLGKIYPPKTRSRDFLEHYLEHFNSVELNATHYKIYGPIATDKWAQKAGDRDFKFCPKMYQAITHRGNLKNKGFLTSEFLRGIRAFGDHLGPLFIQVSDRFSPKRKDELFAYLRSLPRDLQYFVEVRHPDWFSKPDIRKEFFQLLPRIGMGAVITDTAGRRDCCHMALSIPKAFVRFVGNGLHPTDYLRLDGWAERISFWIENGLQELYFFMHMPDEAFSPELISYLIEKINPHGILQWIRPKWIQENSGPPAHK
jgi:uncharacterized protein YecE (DUF72 family)